MTDLLATIAAADRACLPLNQRCQNCFFKGRDKCLCDEKFANPGHAEVGTSNASPARTHAHLPVNLLALDLGTNCGWAVAKRDGRMDYGTEKFPIRASGAGERWARYRAWLSRVLTDCEIHVVYFEDVKAHGPGQVLAAHAYGAFLAMTEMVCHQHRVRMVGVGVGQVKKGWTGKGNAKKEAMVLEAEKRGFRPDTDNAADALAVAAYGIAKEGA